MDPEPARPSVNAGAAPLVRRLLADAAALRLGVHRGESGETLVDAGSRAQGGIAAGLRIAEIAMGGLGEVSVAARPAGRWPWSVVVRSSQPGLACLGSQYAGWHLSHEADGQSFEALGSGPARALAAREPLFAEIGYVDRATEGTLIVEHDGPPPQAVVAQVARECGLEPAQMTFIYCPTRSLAGVCQVAARVLEVALHKAHALEFPLTRILDGMGSVPLAPPHPDFAVAMGRTNDAIIYAGRVQIYVAGAATDAKALAQRLPSSNARDHGRPFAEIFRDAGGDFYAIDPMLFSPAEVIVTAVATGESFHAGGIDADLVDVSFGA